MKDFFVITTKDEFIIEQASFESAATVARQIADDTKAEIIMIYDVKLKEKRSEEEGNYGQ